MTIYNEKTRITTSVMGVLLALSGAFNHGIFEILQGNTPTPGFFIEAIGKPHRFWIHGTEFAVTLIPNFMITGMIVLMISAVLIIWSVKYVHLPKGDSVFLLLMILLTLTGGGIGHIVFFLPVYIHSTRIHKPLRMWRKILAPGVRNVFAKLWHSLVIMTALSWLVVMELGIFGWFPGQQNPDTVLSICFGFVLLTVFLANAAYIGALSRDIGKSELHKKEAAVTPFFRPSLI